MQIKDKKYFIYIQATKQKVSVTKEQFDDYYRDINTYRKKQQRQSKCTCPPTKRLLCTMDCIICPYQAEKSICLDELLFDDVGNEMSRLDYLQGKNTNLQSSSLEEIISDTSEMKQLLQRLSELMPEAIDIGKLRELGLSERAIEKKLGIGRKTYAYRLKKVSEILKKEFPKNF